MNKFFKVIFILFSMILFFSPALFAKRDLESNERIFNFGHVGIDFKFYHNFLIYNMSKKNYNLDSINVSCDCSYASPSDTIINPNDTVTIKLEFETKNYYGPIERHIIAYTDYHLMTAQIFQYKSIVGQWPAGVKPNPISLFFLPGNELKKISIPNPVLDNIKLVDVLQFDTTFSIEILNDEAAQGEKIELSVQTSSNLPKGTYYTNFTLYIDAVPDKGQIILTIPIKIVRY